MSAILSYNMDQQFFTPPLPFSPVAGISGAVWNPVSSTSFSLVYPLIFNKADWRVTAVQLELAASQTYVPITGVVKFPHALSVRSFNPDGKAELAADNFFWSLSDAGNAHSNTYSIQLSATQQPERVEFVLDGSYILPLKTVTAERLHLQTTISALLRANRNGVTSIPTWGTPQLVSSELDWSFLAYLGIAGVIGIAGLTALGYASEKTGLNVGSVGGAVKGVGDLFKGIKIPKIPKIKF